MEKAQSQLLGLTTIKQKNNVRVWPERIVGFDDVNPIQRPDPLCWCDSNLNWAGKLFTAVKVAFWQCVGENSRAQQCSMEALQQPKHKEIEVIELKFEVAIKEEEVHCNR
ncbi:hypothetical protein HAX54_031359 [Datura stramonium]|uniref:Uncharacterized protein n=1 Tax=Datura stramonium TaxID=4076 RepID=A0ABS8VBL0_DATST|nr:hypothetical protein [Datura stramonium]